MSGRGWRGIQTRSSHHSHGRNSRGARERGHEIGRGRSKRQFDTSVALPDVLARERPFGQNTKQKCSDMSNFVQAMADASHIDEVILSLGKEANLSKIDEILQLKYEVGGPRTFELVILPFITFLTSEKMKMSTQGTAKKTIYRHIVNEPLFLSRMAKCFTRERSLLDKKDLLGKSMATCIDLLYEVCRNIPNVIGEDRLVYEIACNLHKTIVSDQTISVSPQAFLTLEQTLDICEDFLPEDAIQPREKSSTSVNQYRVQPQKTHRVLLYQQKDRGPRHDNDDVRYDCINTLPTHEEICWLEEPRLPFYPNSNAPLESLFDYHFRLVREDTLAQFRRGIQWFLGGTGLKQFNFQRRVQPPLHENIPNLLVCNRVELVKLECHVRKGVYFAIHAAQPYAHMRRGNSHQSSSENNVKTEAKASTRREFWARSDRLSVGSLVALAFGVKTKALSAIEAEHPDAYPRSKTLHASHVFYGTVAARNDWELSDNCRTFTTHLKFSSQDSRKVIGLLRGRNHVDEDIFLLEVSGMCFPPTRAILQTLQAYDVRQPPELLQQLFADGSDRIYTAPPIHDDEKAVARSWNLQHLVKEKFENKHRVVDLRSVPITTFESLCTRLNVLEQKGLLKLDDSQVEAFAVAMTRACCLIQGPPGTGKSYVGIKIVETLLKQHNKLPSSFKDRTPILCICYTNHALDQFLEGLVESGACELNGIVRIGGSSKSELLQSRNLVKLESFNSSEEHYAFGRAYRQCKDLEEEIFDAYNQKKGTHGSFLRWLSKHYAKEHQQITQLVESEDDEGFSIHDSRGNTPTERWNSWTKGKNPAMLGVADKVKSNARQTNETDSNPRQLLKMGEDLWTMSKKERKILQEFWIDQWLAYSDEIIICEMEHYEGLVKHMREISSGRSLRILQSTKIVGLTTTGCAQNQDLVRALSPKIAICEEAGEVLEAHLLACITPGIQQLIQIGDHLQLRPLVNEYKLSASSRRGYNLDISLFERLVTDRQSFYDNNLETMRSKGVLVTLQTQRRMRPVIADLVRYTLYPSLQDSSVVRIYPDLKGFRDNLWFFDHDHLETYDESSKSNQFEAEMVVELVSYAMKQGYSGPEIAVLTPYIGQLRLIRCLLGSKSVRVELEEKDAEELARLENRDSVPESNGDESKLNEYEEKRSNGIMSMEKVVRLSTVDNFQGNEATVVFISTVRCNDDGHSGFLKIPNRMNVMLSRAKHGMIMFGSSCTIRKEGKADMFMKVLDLLNKREMVGNEELVLTCQKHNSQTTVTCAKDIRNLTPDGGCLEKCRARLACGHVCPKMCHVDDPQHEWTQCMEPCDKQIGSCGHFCRRRCSETCVCDRVYPVKELPCGHKLTNLLCPAWQQEELKECDRLTKVAMPVCGHEALLPCPTACVLREAINAGMDSQDVSLAYECNHKCGRMRDRCGHDCTFNCGDCLQATGGQSTRELMELVKGSKMAHTGACTHPCNRSMACGHYCKAVCHKAGKCPPCGESCANLCSHSTCNLICNKPCASCSEACGWYCPHMKTACPLPCGSPCIRLPCDKRCDKMLADCGHQCPGLCGEPCLSRAYCRECGESSSHFNDVVDVIMHTTLGDQYPDDSPLIQLGCGHALTVETMDGILELSNFYSSVLTDNAVVWTNAKPLESDAAGGDWVSKHKCPHCRALVVGGINRYGRVLKYAQARSAELKYLQGVMKQVQDSRE